MIRPITAGSARIHSGMTHNVNSNRTEPMWVLGRVPFLGYWWTREDPPPPQVNEGRFLKMFLGVQLSPDLAWKINHNSIKQQHRCDDNIYHTFGFSHTNYTTLCKHFQLHTEASQPTSNLCLFMPEGRKTYLYSRAEEQCH